MSPYLDKEKRGEEQAMFEVWDKRHRNTLGEVLQYLHSRQAPGRFSVAVDYAIERLNVAAAERIKGK